MDPAGTTKVMQAVVTPKAKRIMVMEVVDVSSLKPTILFRTFFFLNVFLRRIAGPGIPRPTDRLYVHLLFFIFLLNLIYYPTNPAGGGFMSKAKEMLHDFKDGGNSRRKSGGGYTRPGNEGDY